MVLSRNQVTEIEEVILEAFKRPSFVDSVTASLTSIIEQQLNIMIVKYEATINEFKTEMAILKKENIALKKQSECKADSLEQYSRRNNIRIIGVPESVDENVELLVNDIVTDKLKLALPGDCIERCHRVGKKSDRARPIIVKFVSYKYKKAVFRAKSGLKHTKILIREDLTKVRFDHMKALSTKYGIRNVWSADGELFYKEDGGVIKFNDYLS